MGLPKLNWRPLPRCWRAGLLGREPRSASGSAPTISWHCSIRHLRPDLDARFGKGLGHPLPNWAPIRVLRTLGDWPSAEAGLRPGPADNSHGRQPRALGSDRPLGQPCSGVARGPAGRCRAGSLEWTQPPGPSSGCSAAQGQTPPGWPCGAARPILRSVAVKPGST